MVKGFALCNFRLDHQRVVSNLQQRLPYWKYLHEMAISDGLITLINLTSDRDVIAEQYVVSSRAKIQLERTELSPDGVITVHGRYVLYLRHAHGIDD